MKAGYAAKKQEEIDQILKRLENGVTELFDSEKFKKYLSTVAKFPHYSCNNQILIYLANPESTYVCGYRQWQKDFNRQVKKGEKGIRIIAPNPYERNVEIPLTDPLTGKTVFGSDGKPVMTTTKERMMGFRAVSVYDISQTEGDPLPQLVTELDGSVEGYDLFLQTMKKVSPVPIAFEEITTGAKGYYHLQENRIAVKAGMSQVQTVKTLVHECTHALLHNREAMKDQKKDTRVIECEAEACAFVVCKRFGIEVDDYSFGYIGSFSSGRDLPELKASLQTIRDTSAELIDRIEEQMSMLKTRHRLSVTAEELGKSYTETVSRKIHVYSERPLMGQGETLPADVVKAMTAEWKTVRPERNTGVSR